MRPTRTHCAAEAKRAAKRVVKPGRGEAWAASGGSGHLLFSLAILFVVSCLTVRRCGIYDLPFPLRMSTRLDSTLTLLDLCQLGLTQLGWTHPIPTWLYSTRLDLNMTQLDSSLLNLAHISTRLNSALSQLDSALLIST